MNTLEELNRIIMYSSPGFELRSAIIQEYINTLAEALVESNKRIELLEQQVHILLNAERQ
jgi:uncharacterized coiled-coil protein SlyX